MKWLSGEESFIGWWELYFCGVFLLSISSRRERERSVLRRGQIGSGGKGRRTKWDGRKGRN